MGFDDRGQAHAKGGKNEAVEQQGRPEKKMQDDTEKQTMRIITPPVRRARMVQKLLPAPAMVACRIGSGNARRRATYFPLSYELKDNSSMRMRSNR